MRGNEGEMRGNERVNLEFFPSSNLGSWGN